MRSLAARITTLAIALGLALGVMPFALAAGITISPPKFEFDAEPGQVIRDVIKINNQDTAPLTLSPSVQDFVAGGETGQPTFIDATENDPSISIGRWITVGDGTPVTIQPGARAEVPFTINVPTDAEPGGHYGAIFFQPPAGDGQVAITQRIGSLVLVRVRGDIQEAGRLDRFGLYDADLKGEDVPTASTNFLYSQLPASFAIRYQNEGNIHLKPQGKIEIRNFGIPLDPVGVISVVNDQGVETKKEIVDYIPVNDSRGNVLAKSYRTFRAEWAGTPYWYKHEDGTREIRYKGFPIGFYSATLTLTGAGGEEESETVHFIVFPWKEILGGAALAAALIYGFLWYRRWSTRRMEEMFKRKFGVTE